MGYSDACLNSGLMCVSKGNSIKLEKDYQKVSLEIYYIESFNKTIFFSNDKLQDFKDEVPLALRNIESISSLRERIEELNRIWVFQSL